MPLSLTQNLQPMCTLSMQRDKATKNTFRLLRFMPKVREVTEETKRQLLDCSANISPTWPDAISDKEGNRNM